MKQPKEHLKQIWKEHFFKKMNLENTEKLNLLSDKAYFMEKNSLNVIQKTYHEQL